MSVLFVWMFDCLLVCMVSVLNIIFRFQVKNNLISQCYVNFRLEIYYNSLLMFIGLSCLESAFYARGLRKSWSKRQKNRLMCGCTIVYDVDEREFVVQLSNCRLSDFITLQRSRMMAPTVYTILTHELRKDFEMHIKYGTCMYVYL